MSRCKNCGKFIDEIEKELYALTAEPALLELPKFWTNTTDLRIIPVFSTQSGKSARASRIAARAKSKAGRDSELPPTHGGAKNANSRADGKSRRAARAIPAAVKRRICKRLKIRRSRSSHTSAVLLFFRYFLFPHAPTMCAFTPIRVLRSFFSH